MSVLWSDLRLAVRVLMKAPGFSFAAILALALGIGPNTAIFSIVYATLLAPLPYADPDQLVTVWSKAGDRQDGTSPADYLAWKEQATSFQYLEPFRFRAFNLAIPEAPERIRARMVSPDGHRMLGEGVLLGRDFRADEDQPGKNQVVLLSHRLWRDRFGADADIIGRDIRLDATPYTVIGVLPPGPQDRQPADLWIPLSFTPDETTNRGFRLRVLMVLGRLKPGVTIEQAQQEMNIIADDLARRFLETNRDRSISVEPLQNSFVRDDVQASLWLLLGAVTFVVLIACVNVANLLLSRGVARERETAIRAALGATRGRLARQVLTESLVLAAAGGILGALSGVWLLQGILAILPPGTLSSEADPRLSVPVLLFTLAATLLSGLLCGAAQAWQAGRADVHEALKQAGRSATGSRRRRLRHALVVVEFALAVTLLAGAGLTILSFWNRTQVDLGVRTDHILTFGLPVNEGRFSSGAEIDGFYGQLLERLRAVPGVLHASATAPRLPHAGAGFPTELSLVGQAADAVSSPPRVYVRTVTPAYFETFGIQVRRGRKLTERDGRSAQRVALVNERFVELFLEQRDPLRQRLVIDEIVPDTSLPGSPTEWQIVGVVRNVANVNRFGNPSAPQICVPFAQSPWPDAVVAVRTATDPEAVRQSVAAAVHSLAPELSLIDVQTMDQVVGAFFAPDRVKIALFGGLALLALMLAALGIYGIMTFAVAQRTPEIGLRMALGAGHGQVRLQILREGLTLAAGGLVLGLVGAYGLGRAMQSILYGTGALSLPVVIAAALVLLGAALVACYVPARRASAVDPMVALRQE